MEDRRIEDLVAELNTLQKRVAQSEARQDVVVIDEEVDVNNNNVVVAAVKKGDRIRITNRVKKPATWTGAGVRDKEREKVATVTRVTHKQIHFVTDSDTRTWRAPNNVERIKR